MSGTFGDRLLQALTASKKSRAALAKVLRSPDGSFGISPSAVGQVINGTSKAMNAENTLRAARLLEVDAFWLATGEGRMRPVMLSPRAHLTVVSAAEPSPPFWTDSEVLERMGMLLAKVPASMRAAFGDVLGNWAAAGGVPDRTEALLALISSAGKQPHSG